jgi:hypothetical protein
MLAFGALFLLRWYAGQVVCGSVDGLAPTEMELGDHLSCYLDVKFLL